MQTKSSPANPLLPPLEGDYHFRLGIPSYVIPADILPNVTAFAPYVDDIELVLFESGDKSNLPSPETVESLVNLANANDLSYTIHFPLDRKLGSESVKERMAMQKSILAIMRLMRPLRPFAWILHLEGIAAAADSRRIEVWQKHITGLLPAIIAEAGNPALVCVENLFYPFEWCVDLIESFKLGVCLDVGHLLLAGADVSSHLKRFLPRARVVHLHGIRAGKDHQALDSIPENDFRQLLAALADFRGVLTLELFSFPDISASIKLLNQCLGRKGLFETHAKKSV
ncbi:MAG: cobamide remodeling phosphodiesterase CbiR [Kiritimatiellia bacterium]|nr:cobamide remodeling phosphodiesterase CbiR [Kiritimatiellia bacterium]